MYESGVTAGGLAYEISEEQVYVWVGGLLGECANGWHKVGLTYGLGVWAKRQAYRRSGSENPGEIGWAGFRTDEQDGNDVLDYNQVVVVVFGVLCPGLER